MNLENPVGKFRVSETTVFMQGEGGTGKPSLDQIRDAGAWGDRSDRMIGAFGRDGMSGPPDFIKVMTEHQSVGK